jgi:hypothetical protein
MSPPPAITNLLTPAVRRVFARLGTPQKIQDYLDRLPVNFEPDGDTVMSPRRMLEAKVAHCAEGALFAAAVLMFHRKPVWLVDLRAAERPGPCHRAVQGAGPLRRHQQDQSLDPALARPDLSKPARTGDELLP